MVYAHLHSQLAKSKLIQCRKSDSIKIRGGMCSSITCDEGVPIERVEGHDCQLVPVEDMLSNRQHVPVFQFCSYIQCLF